MWLGTLLIVIFFAGVRHCFLLNEFLFFGASRCLGIT